MKRTVALLILFLLGLVCAAGIGTAAPVTPKWVAYDYTTAVEPPTGWEEGSNSYPMSSYCSIQNGVLILNSMKSPDVGPTYKMKIATPKAGFKFTVVVKAKADGENGMDFDFRTGVRERMKLGNTGIDLNTSGSKTDAVKTTEWHTYFISYEFVEDAKLMTKVYVDGATTPAVQGASTTKDTSGYFRFGDGSSSAGYAGSIDWILWTFDGAYSPDQVNLPAGFALK